MLTKVLLGLTAAILAITGIAGATFTANKPVEPKVICCGECQPGDDCLKKCQLIGEVPKDLKLACCGHCQKGDNCLSCCEVK